VYEGTLVETGSGKALAFWTLMNLREDPMEELVADICSTYPVRTRLHRALGQRKGSAPNIFRKKNIDARQGLPHVGAALKHVVDNLRLIIPGEYDLEVGRC
jgi:hypothetical protein